MLKKLVAWNKKVCEWFALRFPRFFHSVSYGDVLLQLIQTQVKDLCATKHPKILEVGGIDRPLLSKSEQYSFDGMDIASGLGCEHLYDTFYVQSVEKPMPGQYDLIFSMSLLEHVPNNMVAIQSMVQGLVPGGKIIHYLPSRYHPYSLLLRLVGPKWQRRLIAKLRPWAASVTGYPTYFSYCSPHVMKKLLHQSGFKNIQIIPFYRANDYFSWCFPLFLFVSLWENLCAFFKWHSFASGFIMVAEK